VFILVSWKILRRSAGETPYKPERAGVCYRSSCRSSKPAVDVELAFGNAESPAVRQGRAIRRPIMYESLVRQNGARTSEGLRPHFSGHVPSRIAVQAPLRVGRAWGRDSCRWDSDTPRHIRVAVSRRALRASSCLRFIVLVLHFFSPVVQGTCCA
jgi:hypothetical protein